MFNDRGGNLNKEQMANDKEKYIALDLTNPNAMKDYFDKKEKKFKVK